MNSQQKSIGITLFVGALLVGSLTSTSASVQGNTIRHQNLTLAPALPLANKSPSKGSQVKSIAFGRYRLLKSLESSSVPSLLYDTPETYSTILYPIARSDRAYLIESGYQEDGRQHNRVLCYQRQDSKTKLIYRVNLEYTGQPAGRVLQGKSLLERLKADGYAISGRINNLAKNDLAIERDYAQYTYIPYTDTLVVWLFSHANSKYGLEYGDDVALYDLDEDPFTKAKLKDDEFYRRYGLPLAKGELALSREGLN